MLEIINERINFGEDGRFTTDVTEKIYRTIVKRNPKVMKIISACSIDPLRARKATKATRDQAFAKLDAFVRNLHSQGRIPWKSAAEVPLEVWYNMDEVGTDTTKHRNKVIAPSTIMRLFAQTPEGDGKMNMHVTAFVTTRGDGAFKDEKNQIDGACGVVLIHSDKSKSKVHQQAERDRQRNGEAPSAHTVSPRFLEGIKDEEIKVLTTHSGSMTQETFLECAKQFVSSIKMRY